MMLHTFVEMLGQAIFYHTILGLTISSRELKNCSAISCRYPSGPCSKTIPYQGYLVQPISSRELKLQCSYRDRYWLQSGPGSSMIHNSTTTPIRAGLNDNHLRMSMLLHFASQLHIQLIACRVGSSTIYFVMYSVVRHHQPVQVSVVRHFLEFRIFDYSYTFLNSH